MHRFQRFRSGRPIALATVISLSLPFGFPLGPTAARAAEKSSESRKNGRPANGSVKKLPVPAPPASGARARPAFAPPASEDVPLASPLETSTPVRPVNSAPAPAPNSSSPSPTSPAARNEESTPLVFLYTQSLPSPINLGAGQWVLGTRAAYGIADFVELSTDIVRDVTRHYTLYAKVPILEFPEFVASAFIQYSHWNLHHYDKRNPDAAIHAWQPGLVTGFELDHDMAIFIGGNLQLTSKTFPDDAYTSGFANGAKMNFDWSWMYNPRGGRLSENTLSIGTSYDVTSKIWGIGVTHHWSTFEIGASFYPGADHYKVLPILNLTSGF